MILLIDNYDSFTYNLYQQIENLKERVIVKQNNKITIAEIGRLKPDKIVISPGPKSPKESGLSLEIIRHFHKRLPILGVCLGHQAIAEVFGSKTINAKNILHGKTSQISHNGEKLFRGMPQNFKAARYHSLMIDKTPRDFAQCAWTKEKEIMAIAHNHLPIFGIQFHPESFLTQNGDKLIANFLAL